MLSMSWSMIAVTMITTITSVSVAIRTTVAFIIIVTLRRVVSRFVGRLRWFTWSSRSTADTENWWFRFSMDKINRNEMENWKKPFFTVVMIGSSAPTASSSTAWPISCFSASVPVCTLTVVTTATATLEIGSVTRKYLTRSVRPTF